MSLLSIFLASLLGSIHCAGMCGGFATIAADQQPRIWIGVWGYNTGRLCTYVGIGILAGLLGRSLNTVGAVAGVAQLAAFLMGGVLIILGFYRLLSGDRPIPLLHPLFVAIRRLYPRLTAVLPADRPALRAFGIGLLSTLLPCGWLYGFAAIAATTADPLAAAFVMGVFWTGTLPMMITVGSVARELLRRWGAQAPAISSALLIAAGFFSIASHLGVVQQHSHQPHPEIQRLLLPAQE